MSRFTRRDLLQASSLALAGVLTPTLTNAAEAPAAVTGSPVVTRLCFNENPFGPSPTVAQAIARELSQVNRYADQTAAAAFAEQIAAYEQVPVEQVVLGEILGLLGLYLGSQGGPGGEFLYSTPGYLALIDSAANVGSVGVGVPSVGVEPVPKLTMSTTFAVGAAPLSAVVWAASATFTST